MHLCAGACFLGGCGFPSFDFHAGGDASVDTSSNDAPEGDAPSCPATGTVDLCTTIPSFVDPQKVDGRGDEFCSLPGHTIDSSATRVAFFRGATASQVKEVGTLRAAWSSQGLHLHVHVTDANVFVPPNGSNALHEGDAIELYVAGYVPASGTFDDTTDIGAQHIIVSPPQPSGIIGARGFVWTSSCSTPIPASLDNAFFTGRIVTDGWELELDLPWSVLLASPTAAPPTAGAQIGFTFGLDAQDDPSTDPDHARQMLAFTGYLILTVASPSCSSCGKSPPEPFCDDRCWCTPTLR
jgi:hypothetical protein